MNQISKINRVLGVSFSTRGFGYAVIEGENALLDFGRKRIYGDKNAGTLAGIESVIARNQPDILVLQDVEKAKGTKRVLRIKKLHQKVVALAKKQTIKVSQISGKKLRVALLNNEDGTKHEMAELMAKQFPDELAALLPPKRTVAMNEDARMDIFDAVGLVASLRPAVLQPGKSSRDAEENNGN